MYVKFQVFSSFNEGFYMRLKKLLFLTPLLAFIGISKAQSLPDYVVHPGEVWATNQTINTNVVIPSGVTLTIEAGVRVGVKCADVNLDGIGDVKIIVQNGGSLVIKGGPGSRVVFEAEGARDPSVTDPQKHWTGIIFESSSSSFDTLKYFALKDCYIGLEINRPTILQGVYISGMSETGIKVNNTFTGNVEINDVTIKNSSGKGIVINKSGTIVRYATIDTLLGTGIEVNAPNVNINWARITRAATGIQNNSLATNTVLRNADIKYGTKSGLFNLDGSISVINASFNANAYNGVINSSGVLTMDSSQIINNGGRGLLIGGFASATIKNITDTNNANYGVDIVTLKITEDASYMVGSSEGNPTQVKFNYSNIYNNNGAGFEVNNNTNTVADFTANYWGQTENIGSLVSMAVPGNINYINWYNFPKLDAKAFLNPATSITITYPFNNQDVITGEPLTATFNSIGFISSVVVTIDATVDIIDTIANGGKYTFTVPAGIVSITVQSYPAGAAGTHTVNVNPVAGLTVTSYNAGGTIWGRSKVEIRWVAPSTTNNVKIEYSNDGAAFGAGNVFTIINSTSARTGVGGSGIYEWLVPNLDIATARFRVTDVSNGAVVDMNDADVDIRPTPPSTDESNKLWYYKPTHHSMTYYFEDVQFQDATAAELGGEADGEAVYIGAFYLDESNNLKCAGYNRIFPFDGAGTNPVEVTIFGDDIYTTNRDGVPIGQLPVFKIWRMGWSAIDDPDNTPPDDPYDRLTLNPAGNVAFLDGRYEIIPLLEYRRGAVSVAGIDSQDVAISAGWNLISSYIIPSDNTLGFTLGASGPEVLTDRPSPVWGQGVMPDNTGFTMLKKYNGLVYWWVTGPNVLIDQLSDRWEFDQGYYCHFTTPAALRLIGLKIQPEATGINLNEGWNLAPYFRDNNINIEVGLHSIAEYLTLAKDENGNLYAPAHTVNTIGDMKVGEAYLIKLSAPDILVYPANSYVPKAKSIEYQSMIPERYVVEFKTNNNASIIISQNAIGDKLAIGDEIGVFADDGTLVGSAVYQGGNIGFSVWGKEIGADSGPGLKEGEYYYLKAWDKAKKCERMIQGLTYGEGGAFYTIDGISVINSIEKIGEPTPKDFAISQNYPNPFNPTTTINFDLPVDSRVSITIYNVLGQAVKEIVNADFPAGYHKVAFDGSNLSSGVYIYQIKAGQFTAAKKMNLIK